MRGDRPCLYSSILAHCSCQDARWQTLFVQQYFSTAVVRMTISHCHSIASYHISHFSVAAVSKPRHPGKRLFIHKGKCGVSGLAFSLWLSASSLLFLKILKNWMFYINDEPEDKFIYTETIKLYKNKTKKHCSCKKKMYYPQSLSLIHIWRCRRDPQCRSRWSPYH